MTDEYELLKKRFLEFDRKAYSGGYYTFTDFLGLAEQAAFAEVKKSISSKYTAFGGVRDAERVMIRFGDPEEIGYELEHPIVCIRIAPKSEKYADKLTHRDFLGSLMNLGIERDTLGDIVIRDNVGYLFAKEDIAEYVVNELTRVKKTDVKSVITEDIPEGDLYKTERRRIQAVGERLDAVIAKVFSLSRDDASMLFKRKLVFADGRQIESTSYIPKRGERISVRGYGRMIYLGYESETRKGKLNIELDVYV